MATKEVYTEIAGVLSKALTHLNKGYRGSSLTDIFLVVDNENSSLAIFDDEENLLSKGIIGEWSCIDDDRVIASQLRKAVNQLDLDNKFDTLDLFKPFSVNIADSSFNVLEELLVIEEDSIIRIEEDFLDRMDKEFDDFLENLMNN